MEETNPRAGEAIKEAVRNQLREANPPEVVATFRRLRRLGNNREECIRLIACALSCEMYAMLKNREPYDNDRYVANLRKLPEMPWEE